jgi:Cyclopropane fatty acid synthase and related methyltransferases
MSEKIRNELLSYYNQEAGLRNESPVQEWKYKLREAYLSLILSDNKKTLLEIGAGPGKDSKFFSDNGLKVTAVDLSAEMVRHCREKGIEAYELDYSDVRTLGRMFDCIWSMNSLLHLEKDELPPVLKELDSVLNPDGLFYMGVYGGADREAYRRDKEIPIPRFFLSFLMTVSKRY